MFATHLPRPLWGAFGVNSVVLTAATLVLAVSPATVSSPIAVAEAVVLVGGLAVMLGVNLALLGRVATRRAPAPPERIRGSAGVAEQVGVTSIGLRRLLVCWTNPPHPFESAGEEWAAAALERVLAADLAGAARLARLRRASRRYRPGGDWLLEIDLAPRPREPMWLGSPAWMRWLGELRSLGMYARALVAEPRNVLRTEAD